MSNTSLPPLSESGNNNNVSLLSPNNRSSSSKKSSSKKKEIIPLSIENVYNQKSLVSAGVLNPPLKPVVLTPRSAQVCLKLGVNPEVLKFRDIESFWELDVDPAVQRMRYEAYIQRRYDLMKQCRKERKHLLLEYDDDHQQSSPEMINNNSSNNNNVILSPEMLIEKQKEQTSTLIKMELQRLAKIQKRQEKELEQMIQHEVNRAKIQEDMACRLAEEKKKEHHRRKQQEKRLKLLAEERRLRELQRVAIEQSEEEKRTMLARDMHEREVHIAEEFKRRQGENKEKLKHDEVEKKRLHDDQRRQLKDYFESERIRLRDQLSTIHEAEKKKHDALMIKQHDHAEKLRLKRLHAEKRIEENIIMSRKNEEKRKRDIIMKQEAFERKRVENMEKMEYERNLMLQDNMLQEQRRQMILHEQRRQDEMKSLLLQDKFVVDDIHVMKVQEVREKEYEILKEKKMIQVELKKENVERVARMKEYQKLVVLKKIEDTDSRVKTMLEQRRQLIAERRRAAAETKRQKETITKVMDEVRSNATKASHFVNDALAGRLSITDIARGDMTALMNSTSPHKRSSSSSSSSGVKKQHASTTSELLGLQTKPRQTKSEGFDDHVGRKKPASSTAWHDQDMIDAALNGDLNGSSYNKSFVTQDTEPVPYMSPYGSSTSTIPGTR